jgi:hypothetical protein
MSSGYASMHARVEKEGPLCFCTGTGSPAPTCSRSRGCSLPRSRFSCRTCRGSAAVSSRPPHSASPTLPRRSLTCWTRPTSSVPRSLRIRWAARSLRSSPSVGQGASGRSSSSVRLSIRSDAPRAASYSTGYVMQHGNRGRCSPAPLATTFALASQRSWRPHGRLSPTGSRSACR